jgi:hypothetical protein
VSEEFRVYPLALTSPWEQVFKAVWTIAKGETNIKLMSEILKREEGAALRALAPSRLRVSWRHLTTTQQVPPACPNHACCR